MTIVAVNGGGNTPQGVQLERCFVKSWSTSGDADGTNDSFIFADYKPTESLAVDPTNPDVDWSSGHTGGARVMAASGSSRWTTLCSRVRL